MYIIFFFFFSSRRRHTRFSRDWSSDVCSSDLDAPVRAQPHELGDFGVQRLDRRVEIGRASCRERGVDLGGRRIIKKKKQKKKKVKTAGKKTQKEKHTLRTTYDNT